MQKNIIMAGFECDDLFYHYRNNGYNVIKKELGHLGKSDFAESIIVSCVSEQSIKYAEKKSENLQKIIFVYETEIPSIKDLMRLGFSRLIELDSLRKNKNLIFNIQSDELNSQEKFIIAGKKDYSNSILQDIFSVYTISYEFVEEYESLFKIIEEEKNIIVLFNLDCDEFELNRFVKKMTAERFSKNVPIIPFKNGSIGVSTIDFNCGLHKIAKVILSSQELLSFIVSYLIKRDLAFSQDSLFNSNVIIDQLYRKPFVNIYHEMHDNLLEFENLPEIKDMDVCLKKIDRLKTCFYRMFIYKWLLM